MDNKYKIELPILKEATTGNIGFELLSVTRESPNGYKSALETLALYFQRELGFDCLAFSPAYYKNESIEYFGFLFTEEDFSVCEAQDEQVPLRTIGGGCFEKQTYVDSDEFNWVLKWVWLHPYKRNQGLFTKNIELFYDQFNGFQVEEPLSKAMEHIVFRGSKGDL